MDNSQRNVNDPSLFNRDSINNNSSLMNTNNNNTTKMTDVSKEFGE